MSWRSSRSPSLSVVSVLLTILATITKKEEGERDGRCSRSERAIANAKKGRRGEEGRKEEEKGRNDFQTCNLFASSFIGDDDNASFSFCHASHFRAMFCDCWQAGDGEAKEVTCDQT